MEVREFKEWVTAVLLLLCITLPVQSGAQIPLTFSAEQIDQGEKVYQQNCARCHGAFLTGAGSAPALFGESFVQHWAGQSVGNLFSYMKKTMPPEGPGGVDDSAYSAIIAYILDSYGVYTTNAPLPSSVLSLSNMLMPAKEALYSSLITAGGGVAPEVTLPDWPIPASPLSGLTRVTDAVLINPADSDWPSWRRTLDAANFSPLRQINSENVGELEVAWTLALPPGANQATPLIHDGVMFVRSHGDHLQALNATTGDELWHHRAESKLLTNRSKNIALYEDKVFIATADSRLIAVQSKTGKVDWTWSATDEGIGYLTGGGPMIVQGVVMQGSHTSTGVGSVIGLDAASGKLLWQFHTIAQPGQPYGNSWNGIPVEKRSGGKVWTAGSYDAERGLALFGPSATYDTQPLRDPVSMPGVTNAALFTNSTIALEPRTGRLAWSYQHFPNDQWDLDWAFERQIMKLKVDDKLRRIVLTAGKPAIFDAIDADTGQYIFSIDLGLQNLISNIDPRNGNKQFDKDLVPGVKDIVTVCPHVNGGKSWLPSSYDQENRIVYVPLVESCMDLIRDPRRASLGTVRWTLRPPPGSDGRYGRLEAINVETRKTVWVTRQRAPQTSGVLATAGRVVFAGALDRWFTAYNAKTGDKLWKIRLSPDDSRTYVNS